MIGRIDDQPRLPGMLITVDGPGGVGKSSADAIAARIVCLIHRTLGEKSLVCP